MRGLGNHDDGRDPDHYTHRGPRWQWPLRWFTIDLYYMVWYAPQLRTRPRREQVELACTCAALLAVTGAAAGSGWRRNEERYLSGEPELSDLHGRPITQDEYRRLRELAEH